MSRAGYHSSSPGTWWGSARALLDLEGTAAAGALTDILTGRHPETGTDLLARRTTRRRAGWEVVVGAPKSVSLVAALGRDIPGATALAETLAQAHSSAVAAAFAYLEPGVAWYRSGSGGAPGSGLVAAAFEHSANASGEPHLHTHIVIANLTPDGDRWRALEGRRLWFEARAAGAVYSLSLRHQVRRAGFTVAWTMGPGGAVDVAGVNREAIEAASTRRRQLRGDAAPWQTARAREVGRRRTRTAALTVSPPPGWRQRVAEAGLDAAAVARLVGQARTPAGHYQAAPPPPPPGLHHNAGRPPAAPVPQGPAGQETLAAVERRLLEAGSRFRPADVVTAAAQVVAAGADLPEVDRLVTAVCARAQGGGGGTYISPLAAAADRAVTDAAVARRGAGAGVAATCLPSAVAGGSTLDSDGQAAVRRLVTCGHGVEILGAPGAPAGRAPLVAQAAVVDAARLAWEAAGHRVHVITDSGAAAARWQALTGLTAGRRPPGEASATVVVVDRADRLATPRLGALLAEAATDGAKVVLVAGGTSPPRRQPRSAVLTGLGEQLGVLNPGLTPALGPAPAGAALSPATGQAAAAAVLGAWDQPGVTPDRRPAMVAAGPAEAAALNHAARLRLATEGHLAGGLHHAGGLAVQAGERVMALRRRPGVPAGTLGTVEVDGGRVAVRWDGPAAGGAGGDHGNGRLEPAAPGSPVLGYGYATTPAFLRRAGPPLLVWGPARLVGDHADRLLETAQARSLSKEPDIRKAPETGIIRGARYPDPTAIGIG
jgi:conjugative relaxase-like TrwC/TraI family protein